MTKKYMTETEAAAYSGTKLHTLRKWRQRGVGYPYIKTETGSIRYSKSDIDVYMESHRVTGQDRAVMSTISD